MDPIRKDRPSASAMWRYSNCLASFKLGRGQPDTPTKDSSDGVKVHEVTALMVSPDYHANPVVPDYEDAIIDKAVDLATQVDEFEAREFLGPPPARIIEQRLWFDDDDVMDASFSGQPDIILIDGNARKAAVIDYKSGWGEYEGADTNLQLRALAVLVDDNYDVDQVVTGLFRPGKKPTIALYTRATLDASRIQLQALVDRITNERLLQQPTPGDWCQFCPARAICPATHAAMNQLVPAGQHITTIQDVPVEDFNSMMDRAQVAKKLIKSLEEECKRRAVLNQEGLGWTIGEGDNMRSIPDPRLAFEKISGFVTADEFLLMCKPSISKIEGAVKEKMELTGAQAKATTNDLLGEAIVTTKKSGSLERVKLSLPPK